MTSSSDPAVDPAADDPVAATGPQHWEADVLLSDGGAVHLRPVRPQDGPAIVAMHDRMSERSRYLRYFTAVDKLSPAQVAVFTEADQSDVIALLAELGGQVIAVGTCHRDPRDPQQAEVAFVVEDAQQKRGLASILLEHLAAAAAEVGIRRFTAEVLGENRGMMRVFLDAGYAAEREFSSGVIDLTLDLAPTEQSRSVVQSREHRAEARSIERLLSPRSVAVIGASTEPSKLGHAVLLNLLRRNFAGPVYPVHPERLSVQGIRAYARVGDIPDPVDLAVVTVPAASVAEVVEDCRAKGVHGLVVVSSGFADSGAAGADQQRQLVSLARANGMRVLGPNCLGLVNTDPQVRLNATLAPVVPGPGRVGFFCQSGALGIAILADATARGLGLSSFVSAGNRADVSGNDLLQFWSSDDRTELVLLYLESFGNPRKFARLARVLARAKPVIAVKSGRHATVSPGLALSSVPLSGDAVATLFAQSGVIRTDTLAEAFDVAQLLAHQPIPQGDRVAILGNSTALGILALDACLEAGLTVVDEVPVDFGVNVSPQELADAVSIAVDRDDVDAVVVVYVPPVAVAGQEHAQALRDVAARSTRVPVMTTFLAVDGLAEALTVRDEHGGAARGSVPSFRTPERAVAALAHAVGYSRWLRRPAGDLPDRDAPERVAARTAAQDLVQRWGTETEHQLTDEQLVDLLRCYGIEIAPFRLLADLPTARTAAADIGYPVVLKAADPALRHRVDQLGVQVGLADEEELVEAWAALDSVGAGLRYVQQAAPADRSGVPTVFTITADPSFGALVSFGIGGVATDLLDDRAFRAVPLTDVDAVELIDGPRTEPLLSGYRGSDPVAKEPLRELALKLSALADDVPELQELRLRPVLVGPGGLTVAGAEGRIGPPAVQPDTRRRLR